MEQWFDNGDKGSDEDANVDLRCRVLGRLCDKSGITNSQKYNLKLNDSVKCGSCHCSWEKYAVGLQGSECTCHQKPVDSLHCRAFNGNAEIEKSHSINAKAKLGFSGKLRYKFLRAELFPLISSPCASDVAGTESSDRLRKPSHAHLHSIITHHDCYCTLLTQAGTQSIRTQIVPGVISPVL